MGSRTVGIRVDEDNFSNVKSFFRNHGKKIIKAVPLLAIGEFGILPFSIYRACIDSLIESRFDMPVQSTKEIINNFENLDGLKNNLITWCSFMNSQNTNFHFSCVNSIVNNNFELNWCHHLGITSKNWSTIFYYALQESNLTKSYNIEAVDLGVHDLKIKFIPRT